MSRFILIFVAAIMVIGCNNDKDTSPFDEILLQPRYASITDSIKQEPGRDDLYFRRAILLNKNNFPEPALADFKKAWSLSKQENYALGASNLLLAKNKDEAIDFMQQALKELPNSVLLQMTLAHAYDEQNKIDEALAICNNILQTQPNFISTLVLKSDLLQKKGDTTGTINALEKAHQLIPDNLDISFRLVYQYAETKDPKTIPLADSLIKSDTLRLHADPYYVKGIYYSNIKDYKKAIHWFNETIRFDYNYINAYIEKGKILLDQKKTEESLSTFQLANTIKPSFPDAWYWMGKCMEALGKKEDAKLNYEKAYALDKTFIEAKEAAEKMK